MTAMPLAVAEQALRYIPMPLGIIDRHDGDTLHFEFTRPQDGPTIRPGMAFVVWNWCRDAAGKDAYAAGGGEIAEVTDHEAVGIIRDQARDANWPFHLDLCGAGMPLYLAAWDETAVPGFHHDAERGWRLNGYYISDRRESPSVAELRFLLQRAEEHEANTGIPIHAEGLIRAVLAAYDQAEPRPAAG